VDGPDLVELYRNEGYAIFQNAVRPDTVALLRRELEERLHRTFEKYGFDVPSALGTPAFGNNTPGRWAALVPSRRPFLSEEVIANPRVIELLRGVHGSLGSDYERYAWSLGLIGSDTPVPAAPDQFPHRDDRRGCLATANLLLVDVDETMSPTEIWPGSHLPPGTEFHIGEIPPDGPGDLDRIVAGPAKKICAPAGTIVIRDQRLVHRGTAHHGHVLRPMMTFWYQLAGPRDRVPYRWATRFANAARRVTRGMGVRVKETSPARAAAFWHAHRYGCNVIAMSLSDRDEQLEIPSELWESLSDDAKGLLRYGCVDHEFSDAYRRARSLPLSVAVMSEGVLRVARTATAIVLGRGVPEP